VRFLITGATGLIGKKITSLILKRGDQISALTTNKHNINKYDNIDFFYWNPALGIVDEGCMKGVEVVINLAGSPIAQLWTKNAKKSILESRVSSVKLLENLILKNRNIRNFTCASAIGIYPSNLQVEYTESSIHVSKSFLGNVVKLWEKSCHNLENSNVNVLKLRIGLVLSSEAGLFKPISFFTKYYLGTWFGKGNNFYSWIHIDDIVNSIIFLIDNNKKGIYNLVSPNPVTSKSFVTEIAKAYKTKIFFPSVPVSIVKSIFKDMSELFIFNQKVSCNKLMSDGYKFQYSDFKKALSDLIK
jgi:uncharacterized protein (TIGR01777 family)